MSLLTDDHEYQNDEEEGITTNPSLTPISSNLTFCANQTGLFEEKQERKLFIVHDRAGRLAERLEKPEYPLHVYYQIVDSLRNEIMRDWPALFGEDPHSFFIHIDLDCFYAAVESLEHPEYKDRPLAVGSKQMLATCNYKARKYGIRAGMPGFKALTLCPNLVIVKPNMESYSRYSKRIMSILQSFDRNMEKYGIDEACLIFRHERIEECNLKVDEELRNFTEEELSSAGVTMEGLVLNVPEVYSNPLEQFTFKVRALVFLNTGLTISAGISVCRGLAKLASKVNKPNGQMAILDRFDEYLLDLKVEEINGIGKWTKEFLVKTLGVVTINDLRDKIYQCAMILSRGTLISLLRHSYGLISYDVSTDHNIQKCRISHSISRTVRGVNCKSIMDILWNFSGCLSEYLNGCNKHATLLTITIKFRTFDSITKQKRWKTPFKTEADIFEHALSILDMVFKSEGSDRWVFTDKIRLVGLAVSGFVDLGKIGILGFHRAAEKPCVVHECKPEKGWIKQDKPFDFKKEAARKTLLYYFREKSIDDK